MINKLCDIINRYNIDKIMITCLSIIATLIYPFVIFFTISFIFSIICNATIKLYLARKSINITGRKLYEKTCTCLIIIFLLILLLGSDISYGTATLYTIFMIICLFYSFFRSIILYICILKGIDISKKRHFIRFVLPLFICYVLLGATIPYLKQPDVSADFKKSFNVDDFYSDSVSCDRATIVEDNGEALIERIRMIENAKESIILSTFDFRSDTAGKQVISALMAASDRGVNVKILMDGFNFWTHIEGDPYFYALMSKPNIEIRIYNKVNPLVPWKSMSRMHDKYLIADEQIYLLGGRNTFNYFLGSQKSHKNHDRDVLVYNTGSSQSSIYQLIDYFNTVWNLDYCNTWDYGKIITSLPSVTAAEGELNEIYNNMKSDHADWFVATNYTEKTVPVNKISLLSNPVELYSKEPWVFWGLCQLMENASDNVIIHTPYIICNDMMYDSFRNICDKGINVALMTNSSTNNGNAFGAVDYILNKDKILDTGMNVLEYNGGISYHAKSITIDDNISIIGSFNMDMKSTYQDTELMLVIDGTELNSQLTDIFSEYHSDCTVAEINEDEMQELFDSDTRPKKQLLFRFICLVDSWLRFLM